MNSTLEIPNDVIQFLLTSYSQNSANQQRHEIYENFRKYFLCGDGRFKRDALNISKDLLKFIENDFHPDNDEKLIREAFAALSLCLDCEDFVRSLCCSTREIDSKVEEWVICGCYVMLQGNETVREIALRFFKTWTPTSISNKTIAKLSQEYKTTMGNELMNLMDTNQDYHALQVWAIIVRLLGKHLHHGNFINTILLVAERGFRNSDPGIRAATFLSWESLIDNFATDPVVLGDLKRINLIMIAFNSNNAKNEIVALQKYSTWLHYISCMSSRASQFFQKVCLPFLQFCVGSVRLVSGSSTGNTPIHKVGSPGTPRVNLDSPSRTLTLPTFKSLQLKGCELLAKLLNPLPHDVSLPFYEFEDKEPCDVITGPAFFVKNSQIFLSCARELICALKRNIKEELLYHIWYSIVAHVFACTESIVVKKESRVVVEQLLADFQVIVLSRSLRLPCIMNLFASMLKFSSRILCSTAYQTNSAIHATPILFLTKLYLTPSLYEDVIESESSQYLNNLNSLVDMAYSTPDNFINFCHSILVVVKQNSSVTDDKIFLQWKIWKVLAHSLNEHIKKTNEMNEGDILEPDFGCVLLALRIPIHFLFISESLPSDIKSEMKMWADLYMSFLRVASMTQNAEQSVGVKAVCDEVESHLKDPTHINFEIINILLKMCEIALENFEWSPTSTSNFDLENTSPNVLQKNNNLANFKVSIALLAQLMSIFFINSDERGPNLQKKPQMSLIQNGLITLTSVLTLLFLKTPLSPSILILVQLLSMPLTNLYISKSRRLFPSGFGKKIDKLYMTICQCLQSRYNGVYDSDVLADLAPLLEVTLLHQRQAIKNSALSLWNSTFAKASALVYPDKLREVLSKLKMQGAIIILPSWITLPVTIVEETQPSQQSEAMSQVAPPLWPCQTSPKKISGSFIGKVVSPNIKKSPLRPVNTAPTKQSVARKRLNVDDLRDDEYVLFIEPMKSCRILTEHQKEVLHENKCLPALYNDLDRSQDTQFAYSQHQQSQVEDIFASDQSQCLLTEQEKNSSETEEYLKSLKYPSNGLTVKDAIAFNRDSNATTRSLEKHETDVTCTSNESSRNGEDTSVPVSGGKNIKTLYKQKYQRTFTNAETQKSTYITNESIDVPMIVSSFVISDDCSLPEEIVSTQELTLNDMTPNLKTSDEIPQRTSTNKVKKGVAKSKVQKKKTKVQKQLNSSMNEFIKPVVEKTKNKHPPIKNISAPEDISTRQCLKEANILLPKLNANKVSPMKTRLRSSKRCLRSISPKERSTKLKTLAIKKVIKGELARQKTSNSVEEPTLSSVVSGSKASQRSYSSIDADESNPDTLKEAFPKLNDAEVFVKNNAENDQKINKQSNKLKSPMEAQFTLLRRYSDSKIFSLHRLQQSHIKTSNNKFSSNETKFDKQNSSFSLTVPSPAASPSSGILKRHKLDDIDVPSPLLKMKHVSFSDPLDDPSANDVQQHSDSTSVVDVTDCPSVSASNDDTSSSAKRPLNFTDAIFPELISCKEPIEIILPKINRSRGMIHLFHARGMHTIGHLANLTEVEVNMLPVLSPKVSCVRDALSNFSQQKEDRKTKCGSADVPQGQEIAEISPETLSEIHITEGRDHSEEVLSAHRDPITFDDIVKAYTIESLESLQTHELICLLDTLNSVSGKVCSVLKAKYKENAL